MLPEQDKIVRFVFLPCISTQKKLGNIFVSKINPKVFIISSSFTLINAVIPVDLTLLKKYQIMQKQKLCNKRKKTSFSQEISVYINYRSSAW
jgi:hypothetical protein